MVARGLRYFYVENVAFADFRFCYRCQSGVCETCRFRPELSDQTARALDTRESSQLVHKSEKEPEPNIFGFPALPLGDGADRYLGAARGQSRD